MMRHVFVSAQGTPLTRFCRAIETRSILLEDAVALVALYARPDDAKFKRSAVRGLARYALEWKPASEKCSSRPAP